MDAGPVGRCVSTGFWVVVVAVVVSVAFGTWRLLTDGRFRGTHRVRDAETSAVVEPVETPWTHVQTSIPDANLGEKATLLQFSSAFCAPCRATRRTLSEVAAVVPGVEHLEVDAEHHLELGTASRHPAYADDAGARRLRCRGHPR